MPMTETATRTIFLELELLDFTDKTKRALPFNERARVQKPQNKSIV